MDLPARLYVFGGNEIAAVALVHGLHAHDSANMADTPACIHTRL
jgi:hypothetical protein